MKIVKVKFDDIVAEYVKAINEIKSKEHATDPKKIKEMMYNYMYNDARIVDDAECNSFVICSDFDVDCWLQVYATPPNTHEFASYGDWLCACQTLIATEILKAALKLAISKTLTGVSDER